MKTILYAFFFLCLSANAFSQGLITGQITNAEGEPLSGAHVKVLTNGQVTTANKNGVYRIENLEPGQYELRFSFVGYRPELRTTRVVKGTTKTILHVQMNEAIIQLEGLEVRAHRTATATNAIICFASDTRSLEDIARQDDVRDIPYLLQELPSLLTTSDAGTGIGYTDLRIRGIDATRINVTINGIPLNDAESQKVYWVDLPDLASSIKDIQVQRGVGSSSIGTGAFGANINLSTFNHRKQAGAQLRLSAGSFNTLRTTLSLQSGLLSTKTKSKPTTGTFFHARLSNIRSDGYIDRASAKLRSHYLEGGYLWPKAELRLIYFGGHERTYQAWYGVPAAFVNDKELRTYNPAGTEKPGEPYPDEVDDYTQNHLQAFYKKQLNRNLYLNIGLHHTKGYGFYEQYKSQEEMAAYGLKDTLFCPSGDCNTDLVRRRWLDNDFYGGVWNFHYTNNASTIELIWGGGINNYNGRHFGEVIWAQRYGQSEKNLRYYQDEASKGEINNYFKATFNLKDRLFFHTDLQVRQVNYTFEYRYLDQTQKVNHLFFNPKVGLNYALSPNVRLFASLARAQREPNRNDYVDNSPQQLPRPERLLDYELGFRQTAEKFQSGITLYYMRYKDQLALTGQINDVGEYTRINIPDSYRRGIEIELNYQPLQTLRLSLNTTLSDNRIRRYEEYIDTYGDLDPQPWQTVILRTNTPLAFSPTFIAKGSISWILLPEKSAIGRMELTLFSQYVSRQYIDNSGDEKASIEPYFVNELRLNWHLPSTSSAKTTFGESPKKRQLFFQINNLFNTLYSTNAWVYKSISADTGNTNYFIGFYPQATRHFLLGFHIAF